MLLINHPSIIISFFCELFFCKSERYEQEAIFFFLHFKHNLLIKEEWLIQEAVHRIEKFYFLVLFTLYV